MQVLIPQLGVDDREYVESYVLNGFEGGLHINEKEVIEIDFKSLPQLETEMRRDGSEHTFTPWFRTELQRSIGLISSHAC
jgi:isopentenyldiphosphate isomerase